MKKPTLAITVPCYNEELCIQSTVDSLIEVISDLIAKNKINEDSFIYLVDDGSTDRTWAIISYLHKKNNMIKGVKFIKNFGNQKAHLAALMGVRQLGCD